MKKESFAVFIIISLLCLSTGAFLHHVQNGHHLGKPGLALAKKGLTDKQGHEVDTTIVALPEHVLDYTSESLAMTDIEIAVLPKDTTFGRRRYIAPDKYTLDMSAILMGTDRTSIHKPQFCLEGQGWKIQKSELRSVEMRNPVAYTLPLMTLTTAKQVKLEDGKVVDLHGIYSYWFVCENRLTAKHGERMWWMARDLLLTGTLPRWAYVSCFAVCYPGHEEEAARRIERFISAAVPEFQLPSASLSRAVSKTAPGKVVASAP